MKQFWNVYAPEILKQRRVRRANLVGQFIPHLNDATRLSSLVLEHQGSGLDEPLDTSDVTQLNFSHLERLPHLLPVLVSVPIPTCVEFDNAGIKPLLLQLRKWAVNHHDMRFPFLTSSYAFYRHSAMKTTLELSGTLVITRFRIQGAMKTCLPWFKSVE